MPTLLPARKTGTGPRFRGGDPAETSRPRWSGPAMALTTSSGANLEQPTTQDALRCAERSQTAPPLPADPVFAQATQALWPV